MADQRHPRADPSAGIGVANQPSPISPSRSALRVACHARVVEAVAEVRNPLVGTMDGHNPSSKQRMTVKYSIECWMFSPDQRVRVHQDPRPHHREDRTRRGVRRPFGEPPQAFTPHWPPAAGLRETVGPRTRRPSYPRSIPPWLPPAATRKRDTTWFDRSGAAVGRSRHHPYARPREDHDFEHHAHRILDRLASPGPMRSGDSGQHRES